MGTIASQITSLTIVYSTVYSGAYQRKRQSSTSLTFVRRIHRWPVNSPRKGPVTRKKFPFVDVIMVPISFVIFQCYVVFNLFHGRNFSIAANGESTIALQRPACMFCLIATLTRLKIFMSAESDMHRINSVSENRTMMRIRFRSTWHKVHLS